MFVYIKVFFIFIRHRINPFMSIGKNKDKIRARLTNQEKEYLIENTKDDYIKNWHRKLMYK